LGALKSIAEAGKDIPDDYSLIAFDDIVGADFMRTPLTAIVQPVREIGCKAAEMLFRQIKGNKSVLPSPVMLLSACLPGNISAISLLIEYR